MTKSEFKTRLQAVSDQGKNFGWEKLLIDSFESSMPELFPTKLSIELLIFRENEFQFLNQVRQAA